MLTMLLPTGHFLSLSILIYATAFTVVWLILRSLYYLYFHPLATFPGPRRAAVSTLWLYYVSRRGQPEETFEELHKKYSKCN